jgi:co-chaperonin GroES (HSP10)
MPLGPRVLVKVLPQEALYGEVVEVARAEPADPKEGFGVNVAGVPHGVKVLFGKNAGVKVPWDEELRLLETKEVLATVDEIREDELS